MTYKIVIRPRARAEILEAAAWYDEQQAGRGDTFRDALRILISGIAESPLSFPRVQGEMRRAVLRRYRYGVYFRVHDDEVVIVAVVHGNRNPSSWQGRS